MIIALRKRNRLLSIYTINTWRKVTSASGASHEGFFVITR